MHKFRYARMNAVRGISEDAMKMLVRYDRPGNVRELQNATERATVMCRSEWIEPKDLPDSAACPDAASGERNTDTRPSRQKTAIEKALHESGGRVASAAKILTSASGICGGLFGNCT